MFMLYGPLLGLVAGLATRGRVARLGVLRVRWMSLTVAALLVQLVLFGPLSEELPGVGRWGPTAYVLSSAAVLLVVMRNLGLPGVPLVALGAVANLAAIVANGGLMPASPEALAALGWTGAHETFSNSALVASPALAPLTDLFALPAPMPLRNVFSLGDVAISVGVAWLLFRSVRDPRLDGSMVEPASSRPIGAPAPEPGA